MAELSIKQPPTTEKEFNYFMSQFKGHTTMIGATKPDEQGKSHFTNYTKSTYDSLLELNNLGHDIYFTVNETSPAGRKAEHLESIRAIFADDDTLRAKPKKFQLEPSIITQTSGKDGKYKYHYYWLTETEDYQTWEQVLLGIIAVYETDSNVHDLARILRVPGFVNNKYDPPTPCKLIQCSGTVYEWEDILSAFPPLPKERVAEVKGHDSSGKLNEVELRARFANPEGSGWISNSVNSLIMSWAHNFSNSKINAKLEEMFQAIDPTVREENKDRYYAAYTQIAKWVNSARDKVNAERAKDAPKNVIPIGKKKIRPIDPDSLTDVTVIPKECVPKILYNVSVASDKYLHNGITPAILTGMVSASILLAKNVKIHEIGDTTTTYCSTGIVLAMNTGARKTQLFKILGRPITEYEDELRAVWEEEKHEIAANEFIIKQLVDAVDKEIKKGASKGSSLSEMSKYGKDKAELSRKLEQLQVDKPSVYVQDTTEAAVVDVMLQNQSTISVYTDEGRNFVKNILGRFEQKGDSGGGSAEGWVTNGMGGHVHKTNRKGGGEIKVEDPCLNILAMLQPDIATLFTDHTAYKHSGLAARLPVIHHPVDVLDMMRKSDRTKAIDKAPVDAYYKLMRQFYIRRYDNPMIVELSEGGQRRVNAFNDRVVHLLEHDWDRDTNRTNKIQTQAVIFGTIIAAMDDPDFRAKLHSDPEKGVRYTLRSKYINMGCIFSEVLYESMLKSHTSLDNLDLFRVALSVAKSLLLMYDGKKIYEGFLNNSYLQQQFKVINKDNRDGVIDMLADHGWLYTTRCETVGELNMSALKGRAQIGDTIYHLNVEGVREQLRLQEVKDKTISKQYNPEDK